MLNSQLLEDPSALLVILKLVEAGAGRRKNHDVSGLRGMRGNLHRAIHGGGALDGHAVW